VLRMTSDTTQSVGRMQSVCSPPLTAPSRTLSHPQNVGEKSPDTRADATVGAVVADGEHGHGRGSATGVCTHVWWTLPAAQAAQEAADFATSIESGREAQLWPHNGGRPDFSRLTCTALCHRLDGHAVQVVPVTAVPTQARPLGRQDVLSWRRGCRRGRRWCLQHMLGPRVRRSPIVFIPRNTAPSTSPKVQAPTLLILVSISSRHRYQHQRACENNYRASGGAEPEKGLPGGSRPRGADEQHTAPSYLVGGVHVMQERQRNPRRWAQPRVRQPPPAAGTLRASSAGAAGADGTEMMMPLIVRAQVMAVFADGDDGQQ